MYIPYTHQIVDESKFILILSSIKSLRFHGFLSDLQNNENCRFVFLFVFIYLPHDYNKIITKKYQKKCKKKWRGGLKEIVELMLIRPPQLQ